MRAGERRKDKLSCIRLTRRDLHTRDTLIHLTEFRHIRKVQPRVNAKCKEVHRNRDDIDVARTLTIAEKRTLDAIRTGENSHLRIGDTTATVIVRMKGENDSVTILQMLIHVRDLHPIDMRHAHLHGDRQVDNRLVIGGRLPDIEHGIANFERIFRFCTREGLW